MPSPDAPTPREVLADLRRRAVAVDADPSLAAYRYLVVDLLNALTRHEPLDVEVLAKSAEQTLEADLAAIDALREGADKT